MDTHSPTIVQRSGKTSKNSKTSKTSKTMYTHSPTIKSSHTTKAPSTAKTTQPTTSYTNGDSKSGKRSKRSKSKSSKAKTHKPTFAPTFSPTEADSTAPTYIPSDAIYYDSFEKATFPDSPEWSVTTSEDGTMGMKVNRADSIGNSRGRRLEEEDESSIYWALTTNEAATGVYSIKSPDLNNDDHTPWSAYVTLTTGDDWGEGYLTFSLLWDLNYPAADLLWYVDDEFYKWAPADSSESWQPFLIYLEPGEHKVTWEYAYNPEDYDDPPEAGVAFIDDIYFTPGSPPTYYPTPERTEYPTWAPPSKQPTLAPTVTPTLLPIITPTLSPTLEPTLSPTTLKPTPKTLLPTTSRPAPMLSPTLSPTLSSYPTLAQDDATLDPTMEPTFSSTGADSTAPTNIPTTYYPTSELTENPTYNPTSEPTEYPTYNPTNEFPPTFYPTITNSPSTGPTEYPTSAPTTSIPTNSPTTSTPTYSPSTSYIPSTTLPTPTGLVPSPSCIAGYRCLQNEEYGVNDPNKYNIDLSLEVLDQSNAGAYVNARAKWMEMITGDLPSARSSSIEDRDSCINALPFDIDDLHICGRDEEIDGPGGILGFAQPLRGRQDATTSKWTTITGAMTFDIADIANMVSLGTWESLILHEMGHIIGIGTLWSLNNLINDDLDYLGEKAIDVWVNDWGCSSSAPPVETDFGRGAAGGHWDEDCFQDEFMTAFGFDVELLISKLTIASLEDIGYTVDYNAADDYDGSDTKCCNPSINLLPSTPSKPPLSDLGRDTAVAYGRKVLNGNQRPPSISDEDHDDTIVYVGDIFVTVLFVEDGNIYDVFVTNE